MDAFEEFLKEGFAIYAFDIEGFGRSSGRHGFFHHFSDLVHDMLHFVQDIREERPTKKIFLFGG